MDLARGGILDTCMAEADSLEFPAHMWDKIGFYVYRLVDPRDGMTFYVGKGYGNRVFQHARGVSLDDENLPETSQKLGLIHSILADGQRVRYVVHRHSLTEGEAFHVEAALIDAYEGLTNLQLGHGTDEHGPMSVAEIVQLHGLPDFPNPLQHKLVLIKIPKLPRGNRYDDIFRLVRYCWRISKARAEAADYVIAIHLGRTVGAFIAEQWLPATAENFKEDIDGTDYKGIPYADGSEAHRLGFHGRRAPPEIWDLYVGTHGKRIGYEKFLKAQNPIGYVSP
jgi:hypothetical protein